MADKNTLPYNYGVTYNGVTYRTLEEQVLQNKYDIAQHYNRDRVLADFGIHVQGSVATVEELPETASDFGDAYVVGTQEPFNVYVWTRANVVIGHQEPYWLNIGPIAIEGPQGPVGQQGPQGERGISSQWYAGAKGNNDIPSQYFPTIEGIDNYFFATDSCDIYRLYKRMGQNIYNLIGNIRGLRGLQGPQGAQGPRGVQGPVGPQGPRGPRGNGLNFQGILASVDQLPDPVLSYGDDAYLIHNNESGLYDVYVITKADTIYASWVNAGPLAGGTLVSEGGQFVPEVNIDNKLNIKKLVSNPPTNEYEVKSGKNIVYASRGLNANNNPSSYYYVANFPDADCLPIYGINTSDAHIYAAFKEDRVLYTGVPLFDWQCANKKYVDEKLVTVANQHIQFTIAHSSDTSATIVMDFSKSILSTFDFETVLDTADSTLLFETPMSYILYKGDETTPEMGRGTLTMRNRTLQLLNSQGQPLVSADGHADIIPLTAWVATPGFPLALNYNPSVLTLPQGQRLMVKFDIFPAF